MLELEISIFLGRIFLFFCDRGQKCGVFLERAFLGKSIRNFF